MEVLGEIISWLNFLFPVLFVLFIIYYLVVTRKRILKTHYERIDKSIRYQEEGLGLLREIRDLLKK